MIDSGPGASATHRAGREAPAEAAGVIAASSSNGRGHDPGDVARNELFAGGVPALLWRQRWWFLAALLGSLACAAVYLFIAPRVYLSSARLYVDQAGPMVGGDQWNRISNLRSYLDTQAALITSRPVLSAALENPAVGGSRDFAGEPRPMDLLQARVGVEVGRDSDLLTVSFESSDPKSAAAIVNGIVDAYFAHQTKQRLADSAALLTALQEELRKLDEGLHAKFEELLDPGGTQRGRTESNAGAKMGDEQNSLARQLSSLSEKLLAARLERIKAEAEADAPTADEAAARRLSVAQQTEQALERGLADQRALVLDLHARMGTNTVLESEIRQTERLRGAIDTRIQDLRLMRRADLQPLRVWDPAYPTDLPVRPRKLRTLASALILGSLTGWLIALVRDGNRAKLSQATDFGPSAAAVRPQDDEVDTRYGLA